MSWSGYVPQKNTLIRDVSATRWLQGVVPLPAGMAATTHTSLADAEKTLDEIRWKALEEFATGHYFDLAVLITYAYKLYTPALGEHSQCRWIDPGGPCFGAITGYHDSTEKRSYHQNQRQHGYCPFDSPVIAERSRLYPAPGRTA